MKEYTLGRSGTTRAFLMACTSALILTGCGGGGGGGGDNNESVTSATYEGNQSAATVSSSEEAAEVAYASTEGAYQAIKSQTTALPTAAVIQGTDVEALLRSNLLDAYSEQSQMPTAAETVVSGDCGGEIRFDTDDEQSSTPENGTVEFSYTYDNYCISTGDGGQVITDGTGDYTATYENGELTEYSLTWNLTYTLENGETITSQLTGTTVCEFADQSFTCTYSDDFTGPNGEVYRVENVSVNQDGNGNFVVSARVYDGDLGFVDFDASDIDRQSCDNGNFAGGTITITDSSGDTVVEVSFPNCTECVVTFGGNANTYPQPDRT